MYFDARRIVVEIDGLGHVDFEVWLDDHDRQNELVLSGDEILLRTSNYVVKHEPWRIMDQLERAIKARAW